MKGYKGEPYEVNWHCLDIANPFMVAIHFVINTITIYENQEELVEKEHVSYGGANKNN